MNQSTCNIRLFVEIYGLCRFRTCVDSSMDIKHLYQKLEEEIKINYNIHFEVVKIRDCKHVDLPVNIKIGDSLKNLDTIYLFVSIPLSIQQQYQQQQQIQEEENSTFMPVISNSLYNNDIDINFDDISNTDSCSNVAYTSSGSTTSSCSFQQSCTPIAMYYSHNASTSPSVASDLMDSSSDLSVPVGDYNYPIVF